jgi:hypothetical protein
MLLSLASWWRSVEQAPVPIRPAAGGPDITLTG